MGLNVCVLFVWVMNKMEGVDDKKIFNCFLFRPFALDIVHSPSTVYGDRPMNQNLKVLWIPYPQKTVH